MAWLNSMGEAGASAAPTVITLSASTFQVQPPTPPPIATSWNIFAGYAPERMVLQNSCAIPAGETWTQTNELAERGKGPGRGQEPNYFKAIPRVLPRG